MHRMTGMWAVAMLTGTTHRVHNSVVYIYGLSRSISYSTADNYHVASVTQTENPSLWNKVALSVQQRLYKFTVIINTAANWLARRQVYHCRLVAAVILRRHYESMFTRYMDDVGTQRWSFPWPSSI